MAPLSQAALAAPAARRSRARWLLALTGLLLLGAWGLAGRAPAPIALEQTAPGNSAETSLPPPGVARRTPPLLAQH
jgi:hypothetical protein